MTVEDQQIRIKSLAPGVSTKIYFYVTAPSEEGEHKLLIRPRLNDQNLTTSNYSLSINVGDGSGFELSSEDLIRIKLTPDNDVDSHVLTSPTSFSVYHDGELLKNFSSSSRVRVTPESDGFKITSGFYSWSVDGPVTFVPNPDGEEPVMQLLTMQQLAWDGITNDNLFRGSLEIRDVDGEMVAINELELEDYMRGIAEQSNSEPTEKVKAIAILARSYAVYYMTLDEKFPGMPYHLEDDPDTSQKYGVMSIPTLIFFKGGEEVERLTGALPKEALKEKLDAVSA